MVKIKEQKLITSADDLVELDIIDWHRLNGTSRSPLIAMRDISSWFIGRAVYTVVECDLDEFPQRSDFPGWKHPGNHVPLAKVYWNCFYHDNNGSELLLADQPDFYGTFKFTNSKGNIPFFRGNGKGDAHFWGDFGRVSASAFALTTIRNMNAHDLWISVLDSRSQVVIETLESLADLFLAQFGIE